MSLSGDTEALWKEVRKEVLRRMQEGTTDPEELNEISAMFEASDEVFYDYASYHHWMFADGDPNIILMHAGQVIAAPPSGPEGR